MARRTAAEPKRINLALQGGGAHGAFTWGVLDRLLADPRIAIEGITATSAGAMNAAMVAQGLAEGGARHGRDRAREKLGHFWTSISDQTPDVLKLMHAVNGLIAPSGSPWDLDYSPAWVMGELLTRLFSPYELNPLDINPLRTVLENQLDLAAVHSGAVRLFVSATNVKTGRIKVFETQEITVDVLLASACLPHVFRAVEVDGEHYWDGGYMGNPAIFPLIYGCDSRDVVIVHINPIVRDEVPTTAHAILNRVNEISFNSSLMREMRVIEFVARMLDEGVIPAARMKRMLIHGIDAEEEMRRLHVSSKMNPDRAFLERLHRIGWERTQAWLSEHFDALGERDTVDIRGRYLD